MQEKRIDSCGTYSEVDISETFRDKSAEISLFLGKHVTFLLAIEVRFEQIFTRRRISEDKF